jgi:hypothetical protein
MTPTAKGQMDDPDIHKGAIEGDRPSDEQNANPNGDGVDENGLPNDPVATAQDKIGANLDKTQG